MSRVGIDLDGVCYDFAGSVWRYLSDIGHTSAEIASKNGNPSDPDIWDFYKKWGMDLDDFLKHVHEGVDKGHIFRGPCRLGVKESLNLLLKNGHTIVIVTDRSQGSTPESAKSATKHWLLEHELPYHELHFSVDKTGFDTEYFVEDRIKNYDALEAAGVKTYLVDRPWNQEKDDRRRVDGIRHFVEKIIFQY
jgi:FMN phosphatase YigB (HAD superfamily)